MATENLKHAAEQRLAARKYYIDERVKILPNDLNNLNEAQLVSLVKDLNNQMIVAEENRYDFEMKIRKQDYDVSQYSI